MVASWATRDRQRTHAISLYLADHRDDFLRKLSADDRRGATKEQRRNELLRLARRAFHIESPAVQRRYYEKVAGKPARGNGRRRLSGKQAAAASGEVEKSGTSEGVPAGASEGVGTSGGIQTSTGVGAAAPTTPPHEVRCHLSSPTRGSPDTLTAQTQTGDMEATIPQVEQMLASGDVGALVAPRLCTPSWTKHFELRGTGPEAKVHSCIVSHIVDLRKFYGDIAAADVLGASLRFLYQFGPVLGLTAELLQDRTACQVQAAAILGLAVKMVLASDCTDKVPVSRLWLKVAGNSNISRVRALEIRLLNLWPVP